MQSKVRINTSKGSISAIINKPKDLQKCPLVILMHGFMANKKLNPLKSISQALESNGIASIRFDFNGHGNSYGKFCNMTVENEIEDARIVYHYVRNLDFVSEISLLGHSQGGVVAGMLAGELGSRICSLIQLAPAAVLKDDALNGVLMGNHYDPANPPKHLWVMCHKVGQDFFKVAQNLPIYEVSSKYKGPVLLIHGKKDKIVPYQYSERYDEIYQNSQIILLDEENHMMNNNRDIIVEECVNFISKHCYY